jgi:SAM-dependent methyltransferase
MRQYDRLPFDDALERARASAYPAGEFVGQESFMSASEILALALRAGVGPGVSVLDLCCGVAGAGRFITQKLGCSYSGVDSSPCAIRIAAARAHDLSCRFDVAQVPPVPAGPFDVVMLLETFLAFPDKGALVHGVAAALRTTGRFAFTLEAGAPLTEGERQRMPEADTVWLVPLPDLLGCLARHGLQVRWQSDCTVAHRVAAESLLAAYAAEASEISGRVGQRALDDLLAAHRLWSDWLGSGRVRKYALVAEKVTPG